MSTKSDTSRSKPGPKAQPRKKVLISMTAAEYDEFAEWADEDGMPQSMLMHDLMSRERERRATIDGKTQDD